MSKRISIINFKGGVGKTTLAFHLGTGLARYHDKRVLLVDMDHQSSLSIVCLGASGWQEAVNNNTTIDEVFRGFVGEGPDIPRDEIVAQDPLDDSDYSSLDLVASSLSLDDVEIELTASHQGNAIQSEWNKRTLICRWIEENSIDQKYDYIIFDCPPATKIVSQNAIAASHCYVIPVVPEAVMERGAPHLHQMVRTGIDDRLKAIAALKEVNPRPIHVPETRLAGVVITRIKRAGGYSGYTNDHTQHLKSLRERWGQSLVEPYILDGVGVSEAMSDSIPVYDRWNTQNVGGRGFHTLFQELTAELRRRIDRL
ncbi:MAG: ParA family protein [Spirochaetaceae bacterium]|nr:ParA family protein [Spirochaetaceae bacterium]